MSPALPRPASLAVFSLLLPLGAWIGLLLLRGSPAGRLAVALSFGAAALLYLVTEELLIETRLPEETLLSTAMFFLGFLAIFALVSFGGGEARMADGGEDVVRAGLRPPAAGRAGRGVLSVPCATMCYMSRQRAVAVRALRQNLSVYLRKVEEGETFQVTARGRTIAQLAPLPEPATPMERLVASGRATAPAGDLLKLGPPRGRRVSTRLSDALQEVRGERL